MYALMGLLARHGIKAPSRGSHHLPRAEREGEAPPSIPHLEGGRKSLKMTDFCFINVRIISLIQWEKYFTI